MTPTGSVHFCNILNNGPNAFYVESDNDSTTVFNAMYNWWGAADSIVIEAMVYHHHDDPSNPVIDFMPFTSGPVDIYDTTLVEVVDKTPENLPERFNLAQNYPNPFNAGTVIGFTLLRRAEVSLEIYDILGRRVRNLWAGVCVSGEYEMVFDGRDDNRKPLASGIYFYRLKADDVVQSKKMIILK
ncbi:MAG: T9SS type A sorting domain-containing protein [Candidatus Zixiibacteriota bacterium]